MILPLLLKLLLLRKLPLPPAITINTFTSNIFTMFNANDDVLLLVLQKQPPKFSTKTGVLKNFAKLTGKLTESLF